MPGDRQTVQDPGATNGEQRFDAILALLSNVLAVLRASHGACVQGHTRMGSAYRHSTALHIFEGLAMQKAQQERMKVFRDLYFDYGAPDDMKITVESTGEKIWLHMGLPVTLTGNGTPIFSDPYKCKNRESIQTPIVTLTQTCLACSAAFTPKRETARFCTDKCRVKWNRKEQARIDRERISAELG
jgi:hypothetical protein